MTNFLSGQNVLVVEDDYYLAADTADAVRRAGARVLGPCANEEDALDQIRSGSPTAAVLDINLGLGPSFKLARLLKQMHVPLILITGYDIKTIPGEFDTSPRLQKPVGVRQVLNSLAEALSSARQE